MLDDACRTAQQAADVLGILVGQVAKSIIFRRKSDDAAVLVITSGDRRVDQAKVEALVGPLGYSGAAGCSGWRGGQRAQPHGAGQRRIICP